MKPNHIVTARVVLQLTPVPGSTEKISLPVVVLGSNYHHIQVLATSHPSHAFGSAYM